MNYSIQEDNSFKYIETGEGKVIMLLHGLFGALSNYNHLIEAFEVDHKVVVPVLPMFEIPLRELSVKALANHITDFVLYKGYQEVHLLGNSLGGHIGLLNALEQPLWLKSLTLTGSSGLFENAMGGSYPKRQNYEYIKEVTERTFYDPKMATKELVDNVFEMANDKEKALRLVIMAKSALRHNLEQELHKIKVPTLLIWGKQDIITPPFVGEDFKKGIADAELHFIDNCGHAPMMERPEKFIGIMRSFLKKIEATG